MIEHVKVELKAAEAFQAPGRSQLQSRHRRGEAAEMLDQKVLGDIFAKKKAPCR